MTENTLNIFETMDSSIYCKATQCPRDAGREFNDNSASVRGLLLLSLFFLATAHLCIKALFPNPAFWLIGAAAIVVVGAWWYFAHKDDFGFLLVVFACTHFDFANNQGGLWSYVLCAVLLIMIFSQRRPAIRLSSVPRVASMLLFLLFALQILGTALNPYSPVSNIQATVVAFSHVLVFYYCASQQMTAPRLKRLLSIWFAIVCWVFVMALNQRYQWVITESPLLPHRSLTAAGSFGDTPVASFGTSELCAEYFCIVFALSLVIISHLKELVGLRIRLIFPLLMICLSLAGIVMSGSRAAALLAVATIAFLLFNTIVASTQKIRRLSVYCPLFLFGGFFLLMFGKFFFLDGMIGDFKQLDLSQTNMKTIITGEAINRNTVFDLAYQELSEKSFWVGYGYNLPANNRQSMGIEEEALADFHSLYLSLPIFYGWIGAAAYVLLLLHAGLRIYMCYVRARKLNYFLTPIALGLAIVWGIFLLDQYKISATREPCYFFLTWILLGWTHSVANSICEQAVGEVNPPLRTSNFNIPYREDPSCEYSISKTYR